jgi:hypothetical protein
MKQDFLIKTGLLSITFIIVLGVWFGFRTIDHQANIIDSLTKKVERQKGQIQLFKTNNHQNTQQVNRSDNVKIEESVNVFVQSLYQVKEDQSEQRREKAKSVLTQELFNKYFPKGDKEQNLLYEHEVIDSSVYTQNQGENDSAIVTFEETMISLANNQKENSRITLEVFLQKEGEEWLVNGFRQLNAEPL